MTEFDLSVHFEFEAGLFSSNVTFDGHHVDTANVKTQGPSEVRAVTKHRCTKNHAISEKLCSPSQIGEQVNKAYSVFEGVQY